MRFKNAFGKFLYRFVMVYFLGCLDKKSFINLCMKFSRYCYEHLDGNKCNDVSIFVLDGDGEIRTLDPLLARQVLSQLSYAPINLAATCFPMPSPA